MSNVHYLRTNSHSLQKKQSNRWNIHNVITMIKGIRLTDHCVYIVVSLNLYWYHTHQTGSLFHFSSFLSFSTHFLLFFPSNLHEKSLFLFRKRFLPFFRHINCMQTRYPQDRKTLRNIRTKIGKLYMIRNWQEKSMKIHVDCPTSRHMNWLIRYGIRKNTIQKGEKYVEKALSEEMKPIWKK